ncbi:MAG TPA: signal peptidase II [Patescibacteria group bacterium]|nr:signal peptidase II [Patescibacteria group bacterium]
MNKLFRVNSDFFNIAIISLIAIFFSLDRYLKNLALNLNIGENYPLITDYFSFSFAKNSNIAFSLPLSTKIIFPIIITAIIFLTFAITSNIYKKRALTLDSLLLTFILFGAISNMLDRLLYGYVIDYLSLKNFSIFNLADIMITLTSFFYIFYITKQTKRKTTE